MDKQELYDAIALRKLKPKDFAPYDGNNGRVNKCAQLIRRGELCNTGMLIDVGGGIGDLGASVSDLFTSRIVVDISAGNLEAARAKGNVGFRLDVDKQGLRLDADSEGKWAFNEWYRDGCADLITALDFIEHIIDPEKFARECFRLLKHGGHVFINTPNIRFWRHIGSLWIDGKFPHTSGDREVYHGGHLAFFTFRDLCEIFGVAGFTGFKMFNDEEGYEEPPELYSSVFQPQNQDEYVQLMMELSCPNLLFRCEKQ